MVVLGAVASVVLSFVSMVLLGFASMLPHIIGIVTGIVQVVSAAFNIIAAVITLVVETIKVIFTRNWDEVDAKNKQIMDQLLLGVTQAFTGIFNIIKSNLAAVIDTIKGWVEGVIAFFTGLYNALIGHSIIPDLVEGILGWFNTLKQRGISAISDLVSSIAGKFSGLASSAWSWGKDLVNNWINGIKEAARNLGGWAKDKFGEMTGMYAHGGIIPGPIGAPIPIIAHGGERVVPRSGADSGGGGSGGFSINFYGNISMDSEERIQELADKISRIFGRQNELARYSAGY
jgi:phage-related protein